jgi:hypothetical protein
VSGDDASSDESTKADVSAGERSSTGGGAKWPPNTRLRAEREERGFGLRELANALAQSIMKEDVEAGRPAHLRPVDPNLIYKWEAGIARPLPRYRMHLVKVLGKSASELGLAPEREQPVVPEDEPPEAPRGANHRPGVGAGLPPSGPYRGKLYAWIAAVGAVIVCTIALLAGLQLGPFSKPDVVVLKPPAVPSPGGTAKVSTSASHCPAFWTNVTQAAGLAVAVDVAAAVNPRTPCWSRQLSPLPPGDEVDVLVTFDNTSNQTESNVILGVSLAPALVVIAGTPDIYRAGSTQGSPVELSDADQNKVDMGSMSADRSGELLFSVELPPSIAVQCGTSDYKIVGSAQIEGAKEYTNTTTLQMYKAC